MITEKFLKMRRRRELSDEEKQALDAAVATVRTVDARTLLVRRGEYLDHSTFLIEGLVGRYMAARNGERQLVVLHVAGDFLDLHAFTMKRLDHSIEALTEAKIALVPHDTLTQLTETHPHLTRLLWFSTLLDAAMHRECIFKLGRLPAFGRVAHFFCETNARLEMVGLSDGRNFDLPIVQADIADACGLTPVHVNRVLRQLRDAGLIEFQRGRVTILDRTKLTHTAEFNPEYLYSDATEL